MVFVLDFAETFFKFLPKDSLKQRLLSPENFNSKYNSADVVFQDAIAILLSLSGCSVIPLGKKYEYAYTQTNYRLGSCDLIAYFPERSKLCLVDCTTSIPDENKVRLLQNTINNLSSKEDRSNSKVFGLIPSPRDCSDIKAHYFEDVYILDKTDLDWALNYLTEGKIQDARRKFFF